ncbi:hypothetical protein DICPUDRAFT_82956 [Dictyostelium purpureum]|uniref:Transmembrane protein n=1 Tax=Dictyostelium purpureum TaxID=5786 RepID=F0ZY45_DICPU|nr:uncharacterized protein DICPUDRAFT_82956 [Dictyostelium purpureum]EGC31131.1 hypothetical protein DICPUDRAFT_82956 [Dictyostelium purpureum]|eukprot:XP_003292349.1 hypothetical protein DICPUDRAFT_82956 [Dictyostelium purpureum]
MGRKSPALIVGIIIQFICIIVAFSSFFLPIYQLKGVADTPIDGLTASSIVQLKYRSYKCNIATPIYSNATTFSYSDTPGTECLPFILPSQSMAKTSFYMNVSLATLAIGFIGSVITLLFTFIMSCHDSCRNCAMKFFAFIFSLVPFVFYLASPLVLIAITGKFHFKWDHDSSSSQSIDSSEAQFCENLWCDSFYGSKSVDIPYIGEGKMTWGPTWTWGAGIVASVLALVSSILTLCASNYRKQSHHTEHHHSSNYKYSKLINRA